MKPPASKQARRASASSRRSPGPTLGRAILALIVVATAGGALAAELSLATGPPESADHAVGRTLCRLYNDARGDDMPVCAAMASGGSVANIEALRSGRRRLALVQSDMAGAAARSGHPFSARPAFTGLRVLMALHVEQFTVLARRDAGVAAFTHLKGRRVGVPSRAAGGRATLGKVLQHYGWVEDQAFAGLVELAPADRASALCDGRVDAVIDVVGHPDPTFAAAARRCPTRLAGLGGRSIERMMSRYVAYRPTTIPAGLYPGTATRTPTIGLRVLLMAPASLDASIAAKIVESAAENAAVLGDAHPSLDGITPSDMAPRDGAVPVHPGARDAFRAAGIRQ